MKKILSLILAGLMTLSCAAFVAADDAAAETADAAQEEVVDQEQELAIEFLKAYGIFKGNGTGDAAADLIERWQMALFVARISTGWVEDIQWENGKVNDTNFVDLDVDGARDVLGAISYANQKGIIEGYSATKFAPKDSITYRDALTMVVRTLGYNSGLNYPWGYIQTAVELDLTKGIDAAYTDELTRGEVALIIYNALFAETKGGKTLAETIFDVEFGWETIMVVATDEAAFPHGAASAQSVKVDGETNTTVGFKVVDADGKLAADTYYALTKDLGLENGHDAEKALGKLYKALFAEVDGKLVKLEKAIDLEGTPVINNGVTDDEATPVATQPIAAFLANYDLLTKWVDGQYLTFLGTDLYVYGEGTVDIIGVDSNRIGLDADTGDIVKWVAESAADWANATATSYEVLWYWNTTLQRYYKYEYDVASNIIKVNWMTDEEMAKEYAEAIKYVAGTTSSYVQLTATSAMSNPYAKLRVFDTDLNDVADVAIYKDYAIGSFSNASVACGINADGANHTGGAANQPGYKIVGLDAGEAGAIITVEVLAEAGHTAHEDNKGYQFAWITVAEGVEGFVKEDGTYNNGVVLFDYNKATGEIEIVKYIPKTNDGTDKDSYWVSGILQGYSTSKKEIIVDGETYKMGYSNLVGAPASLAFKNSDGMVNRKLAATELDAYLMQYVEVLIVDGYVVDVDTVGAITNGNAFIVFGYAGMTSDGYIAVYAYDTATATLGVKKINSFNGWKQGDYRYYYENIAKDRAFDKGTVYEVVSSSTDAYGNAVYAVETYTIEEKMATGTAVSYTFDTGYRVDAAGTYTKAKTTEKYIIVDVDTATIYTFVGVPADTYSVEGMEVVSGDTRVIYANTEDIVGFSDNANDIGFVLYSKAHGRVLEAAYDEAQVLGVENYWLLGSTVSSVSVFNVLTATWDEVITSTNIDLVNGAYYMTIGNVIVEEITYAAGEDIFDVIDNYYKSADFRNAKYYLDEVQLMNNKILDSATGEKASISYQIADQLGVIDHSKHLTIQKGAAEAYVPAASIVIYDATLDEIPTAKLTLADDVIYTAEIIYTGAKTIVYIVDKEAVAG